MAEVALVFLAGGIAFAFDLGSRVNHRDSEALSVIGDCDASPPPPVPQARLT